MTKKIKLENGIYHILSKESGPSLRELHDELVDYAKRIKEHDIVLNVDEGNLSKKLKSLEDKKFVLSIRKKMDKRDQYSDSYFLEKTLEAFRQILREFSRDIDTAPMLTDPRNLQKIMDGEALGGVTFEQICSIIEDFVKSEYTSKIIKEFGFESTYLAFKEEVNGHCGLQQFIEIARKMVYDGSVTDLGVFGREFLKDSEEWKQGYENTNCILANIPGSKQSGEKETLEKKNTEENNRSNQSAG